VRCADTYYATSRVADLPGAERVPALAWTAETPFDPTARTSGDPLPVVANHGRWIVSCDQCTSAQLASREDARFACVSCGNAYQGGAFRPIAWPVDADAIGAALDDAYRPVALANWAPGESVEQLQAENALLASAEEGRE